MTTRMVLRGAVLPDGQRDYRAAVIDAAIIGGWTFCSALLGLSATVGYSMVACQGALLSTGVAFFSSLMVSLNIKKQTVA